MNEAADWRTAWAFNVIDEYKNLTVEEIKAELKKKAWPFAVCMSQIQGDFNFGSFIRSANALGAHEVFYYGKKKWDRRSAVGVYHYTTVSFLGSLKEIIDLKSKYVFVGIENIERSESLVTFKWPKNTLMFFGEEGAGLSQEIIDLCDYCVQIPMKGSVRSMNVGAAGAIAMYDYISKFSV